MPTMMHKHMGLDGNELSYSLCCGPASAPHQLPAAWVLCLNVTALHAWAFQIHMSPAAAWLSHKITAGSGTEIGCRTL